MMKVADRIEMRAVADLVPYARNARTHSADQVAQIARSIREFGFTNPVLVDGGGGIVAGHGRVMAAKSLGLASVPVLCVDWLTEAQQRAYVLADNRLALDAGWDDALLAGELAALKADGFDLELTGFADDEIADLLESEGGDKESEGRPDSTPEPPAHPVTAPGDVWIMGRHRVMCGDSTSIDHVQKLMAGTLADLVFTDPPYNVAYSGMGKVNQLGSIENDDMDDDSFSEFLDAVFDCYLAAMRPLAPIYVCHPDSKTGQKLAFERSFGERFRKASTIIWMKQAAGMGWQDYRAQHEPILYGWKPGNGKHFFCGDRTKTTVWQIGRDAQASYVHPTQKPVALPEEAIHNSSKKGAVCLDLFGGSGSTLIACEKTGRVNCSMELDPRYVDVIIRRWQDFTGARAVHAVTGQPFPQA